MSSESVDLHHRSSDTLPARVSCRICKKHKFHSHSCRWNTSVQHLRTLFSKRKSSNDEGATNPIFLPFQATLDYRRKESQFVQIKCQYSGVPNRAIAIHCKLLTKNNIIEAINITIVTSNIGSGFQKSAV